MNVRGVLAIYKFEMHRFRRTLWTGMAVPVITTSTGDRRWSTEVSLLSGTFVEHPADGELAFAKAAAAEPAAA